MSCPNNILRCDDVELTGLEVSFWGSHVELFVHSSPDARGLNTECACLGPGICQHDALEAVGWERIGSAKQPTPWKPHTPTILRVDGGVPIKQERSFFVRAFGPAAFYMETNGDNGETDQGPASDGSITVIPQGHDVGEVGTVASDVRPSANLFCGHVLYRRNAIFWSPKVHSQFPASSRRSIKTILLAGVRVRNHGQAEFESRPAGSVTAAPPPELFECCILPCLRASDFARVAAMDASRDRIDLGFRVRVRRLGAHPRARRGTIPADRRARAAQCVLAQCRRLLCGSARV